MEIMDAIRGRRAVRDYTDKKVSKAAIIELIDAAVMAPTALDEEPWAFVMVQGRQKLQDYSDRAKAHFLKTFSPGRDPHSVRRDLLADPKFNIFYNAGTLVVIYCRPSLQWAPIDCALAAENLMLAAYAMGLGTCPIGFAQSWLDDAEVKRELRVPGDLTAILPIIVGYPTKAPPKISRHKPEITFCS